MWAYGQGHEHQLTFLIVWMTGKHLIALTQCHVSCLLAWSKGEVVLTSAPQRPQTSGESLSLVASTGWYLISTYSPCMTLSIGCKQAAWPRLRCRLGRNEGIFLQRGAVLLAEIQPATGPWGEPTGSCGIHAADIFPPGAS